MKIQLSDHFDYKKILKFVIPSMVMMMFSSIYSVIDDGLFVSNFAGKDAFVALNIMAPVLTIMEAIGLMMGSGGNALISKTLGEKDKNKANEYFTQIIKVTILAGISLTIFGLIILKPFCILMGAKDNVLKNCLLYGYIAIPFAIVFLLQGVFQSLLITAEKPKLAMIITIASGIFNILFDILLMVILKLGIIGAVFATLSGAIISSIVPMCYFIFSKDSLLKFVNVKINWKVIGKVCYNGISELISNLSMGISAVLFNYQLMKIIGNDGVAAYGVIMYIAFVFASLFIGYSMGIAPVIGYHYGAKNKEELKGILKKSMVILFILGIILTSITEITAIPFAKIFVSYDQNLMNITVNGLRIYGIAFIFMGINLFGSSFFTALDNGLISGFLSFVRTLLLQVVLVMTLPIFLKINGVWFSIVISEIIMINITLLIIKRMNKQYNYF